MLNNLIVSGQLGRDVLRGSLATKIAATSPYMYVKGNELSGTSAADSGSGANTFTVNNGTRNAVPVFANSDRSIDFNGTTSYISVANSAGFRTLGDITMMALYNMDSFPSGAGVIMRTSGPGDTSANNILISLEVGPTSIPTFHEYGAGINQQGGVTVASAGKGSHLVILTRNTAGTIYTAYVDGANVGTYDYTTNPDGGGSSLFNMGRDPGTTSFYVDGRMSDFAVWNRVLTADEISSISNSLTI